MKKNKIVEKMIHGIFLILGLITVGCVLLITVYLVISGIPAIREIGLGDFLFGGLLFGRLLRAPSGRDDRGRREIFEELIHTGSPS